ncbi:MAG: DUF2235 domain-containing protein [Rhodobacteraceae bacterium]|nr:DUF2235 domain-containing protein [Paracoccaceae bacterium]
MSSLAEGYETNAGITYKLLSEVASAKHVSVRYEAGVQWRSWRHALDVVEGRGINRQIRRVYGFLASRYRPGDRIFLFGYSRGAYAVRSLAGLIDTVGLLKREHATVRNIRQAYRHYQLESDREVITAFHNAHCHPKVMIEMVGLWDTVKALGLRLPFVWQWTEAEHLFHNHQLGPSIRHGFHALAMDETREAYAPVLWDCPEGWHGDVEQMWFRGTHGDIGGQLFGFNEARPLANIPLVWMLEKAERSGLPLPPGWRSRFPQDPAVPSAGSTRGWGKLFLARKRRVIGQDRSEVIHPSARMDRHAALELAAK